MIKWKDKLIRINPTDSTLLQYSLDNGNTWNSCNGFFGGQTVQIQDLMDSNNEILATTSHGLYYSTDDYGGSWTKRY